MNAKYRLLSALGATLLCVAATGSANGNRHDSQTTNDETRVRIGFKIAPVPLKLRGRNLELLGIGSYIVNTGGCNECHTHPSFMAGSNPFLGQAEILNVEQYMAGGRTFGPVIKAPNITPDAFGRPAGLDFAAFEAAIRTGRKPDGSGRILQVMPWPPMSKLSNRDMRAIYEYLRSIPSLPDNPSPGP